MTQWFPFPIRHCPSRTPAKLAWPRFRSNRACERGTPTHAVLAASGTCEMRGPGPPRPPGPARGARPAPGTRCRARAAAARAGGEARPRNEWAGGQGGAAGLRHSLRKTRYSRVKGAARSSLLKPLMMPETSRRCRRCYKASSQHATPTDKE